VAVVLFDGTCNFCDRSVHFVLDHERDHELKFAALQSDEAKELLAKALGEERAAAVARDLDSVVVVDGDRLYTHSSAAIRIARHLRWPWSWSRLMVIVPRFVRDAVYRWFARHRYQWFGKTETCRVPTPELRARFL
jgi:predicted DCC family thiol-disulfide oxidoreductase YuxK